MHGRTAYVECTISDLHKKDDVLTFYSAKDLIGLHE